MNIDYNANQYLKKKKGIVKTKKKGNETECHAPQFLNMWSSCWNNNKKKKKAVCRADASVQSPCLRVSTTSVSETITTKTPYKHKTTTDGRTAWKLAKKARGKLK